MACVLPAKPSMLTLRSFIIGLLLSVFWVCLSALPAQAQGVDQLSFFQGVITSVQETQHLEVGGYPEVNQTLLVRLQDGGEISARYILPLGVEETNLLKAGERVIVAQLPHEEATYIVTDRYRLTPVMAIMVLFFVLIIAFAGLRGLTALIGLCFSLFLILYVIVPQIAGGADPMLVSLVGSFVIGGISLYLAHGFNRRTTIATISTFITLALAIVAAVSFVTMTKLLGLGSEETLELQYSPLTHINLRGLLLAGIIIGALGVLDDITTAQTAAVEEIYKANQKLDFNEVYSRGMSVGREHITSLVNTLALAYAGASLPTLLLFTVYPQPIWVTLNSELIVEEVIRTVVGSVALTLAVPITTFLAAAYFTGKLTQTPPALSGKSSHNHSQSE